MNRNDFGGAVIPAMAGFFLFGKKAKAQEIQQEKVENFPAVVKLDKGLTGVARYLLTAPVTTSVAKYVKKAEKQQMSGVAKYMLRQSIAEKNAPRPSGVSQYVAKVAKAPQSPRKSTVAKYIAKQERELLEAPKLTGVAKYSANQELIARKQAALELVKKYREAEIEAARQAKEAAIESTYEASKAMILDEHENSGAVPNASTRVGRYLQQQAASTKTTQPTGVAKYLAKQIIIDSQKPKLNKVEKYLKEQSIKDSKKPVLTGVAKYFAKQSQAPKPQQIVKATVVESKVSRYIAQQEQMENSKPLLSGVSRYLENQAREALKKPAKDNLLLENLQAAVVVEEEKCLEGEFIPANEYQPSKLTGVSKYLEKQGNTPLAATNKITTLKATGVSRYLEKQTETNQPVSSPAEALTGVDKYMLRKAS